jgi:hypothetical protein
MVRLLDEARLEHYQGMLADEAGASARWVRKKARIRRRASRVDGSW